MTVWSPPTLVVTVGGGKNTGGSILFWPVKKSPHFNSPDFEGAPVQRNQQVRIICQRISDFGQGTDVWDYIQVDNTSTRGWVSDNAINDTPANSLDGRVTTSCPPSAG